MVKKIYLSTIIFCISIFIFLPIINVPISSSSRGVIRSQTENTKIVSVVGGRVIENKLEKNNQEIKQGETLLVITAKQLFIKSINIFTKSKIILLKVFLDNKISFQFSQQKNTGVIS